ncbi:Guanine nucleotide-binding protein alpha-2 subunit [Lunasporangiospora selenospora]|uniref:Guanine nucleotide-binding protein alpha-2 subunit n=1 Tax=Lunasporangiospora selenospora TaxID=979761 RepID=A0A9P6FJC0_9FUNG|nr:Guanine nucleotide-binding protein alpha-2 subunit [Lunasporangiospora selenospora]
MGLCLSVEEKEQKEISQNIDRGLEEDNRRLKKECKILLLGSGESGKSTIVKQMKVIHQGGYRPDELPTFKLTIYKNLVDSAQALVLAMEKLRLEPELPENKAHADQILDYRVDADPYFTLNPDIVNAIDSLYHDPVTILCMERSSEFYIMDSAP